MIAGKAHSSREIMPWVSRDGSLQWAHSFGTLVRNGPPEQHYFLVISQMREAPVDGVSRSVEVVATENSRVEVAV
jgi:hypothetical protein